MSPIVNLPNEDAHPSQPIRVTDVRQRARLTLDQLRAELLQDRGTDSHWTGALSPSALSTATAVSSLALVLKHPAGPASGDDVAGAHLQTLIENGVSWCLAAQNQDGGFGDTDRSHSNIATTMLVIAALKLSDQATHDSAGPRVAAALVRAEQYVHSAGGIPALRERYGADKTFVIPILSNCALAGMVPWSDVQALPFEAAAVPQSMYRAMRMPVVSYAIPALVAIGQAKFLNQPPRNPLVRWLRGSLLGRTMRVLERMQPESGGYLEATPLTSFVLMSLAATDRADCQVAVNAVRFLRDSVLADGSWPIDTNLATWITSLSIHALSCDPKDDRSWADDQLVKWLLGCQHRQRHPFTGASPGGWGWTDLSGAVPDADDTPAAIIALSHMRRGQSAVSEGAAWLLAMQNRNGGWPTFCRGWGKLPFDRSSTDLTAHAIRALVIAADELQWRPLSVRKFSASLRRGTKFIANKQRSDGAILPLWFGNQDQPDDENPVYGTARALLASGLRLPSPKGGQSVRVGELWAERAAEYLVTCQNHDGGWGGGISRTRWIGDQDSLEITSSVEETGVAIEGLTIYWMAYRGKFSEDGESALHSAILRGVEFLCEAVRQSKHHVPWPIGFYFAKLWYHERQYATVFATAALGTVLRAFENDAADN